MRKRCEHSWRYRFWWRRRKYPDYSWECRRCGLMTRTYLSPYGGFYPPGKDGDDA